MPLGFLNNLVTLINCESLKEMGGMECVTPSRSWYYKTITPWHYHSSIENKFANVLTIV